jgi:hypothetical protein
MSGVYSPSKEKIMNPYHPQPIVVPQEVGKVLEFIGIKHKLTQQHTGGA